MGLLVVADDLAGEHQTWILYPRGDGSGIWIGGKRWPDDVPALTQNQIDDLEEHGWVRVLDRSGNGRKMAVANAGRRAWAMQSASQRNRQRRRVEMDWDAARPLLRQAYEVYLDAGAPAEGIDALRVTQLWDDLAQAQALIRELIRDGWLVEGLLEIDQAGFIRPSSKAIRTFGGWPGAAAQDALDEFVQDLDEAIDTNADDDKRSKLIAVRDGLLGAARDAGLAYFEKKTLGL